MASIRIRRVQNPASFVAYLALCGAGSAALLSPVTGCSREAEAGQVAEEEAEEEALPEQASAVVEIASKTGEAREGSAYNPHQSLAPMIEQVGPAVVSIRSTRGRGKGLFGAARIENGTGSGFILSEDGTVITNHHVVNGASKLDVHLPDGRRFEAELRGSDPATDLAVLELVDADELPVATLGDSAKVRVGDWLVAIGSPLGLEHSATAGILSARGRGSLGLYRDSFIDFLQTDADIAPGSSGGPLFDLQGRVVGITTAVGGQGGPGFAIPINQAKKIIPVLKDGGTVERGWLGAGSDPDADPAAGAVIGEVFRDTPADEAGLRTGDIVKKADAETIRNFNDLRAIIGTLTPGHTVLLEVERDSKIVELSAVLEGRPSAAALEKLSPAKRGASKPKIERRKERRRDALPARLGIRARTSDDGLEVVSIEPGSLASDLQLEPGDVIKSMDGKTIRNPDDVSDVLGGGGDKISLQFLRSGVTHRVTLERS